MSVASQMRLAGLSALLVTNGEALTFGVPRVSVTALVDRAPKKIRDGLAARGGEIDFTLMGVTEVEFPFGTAAQPTAGDRFLDAFGFSHRVKWVGSTDVSWVCYCQLSQTP